MRKWMYWAAAAIAVAVVVVFINVRRTAPPAPPSDAAPAVQVTTVHNAPYDVVMDENGHVGAPAGTTSQLSFPISGILRTVYVHVGDRVSDGEALAALDTRPLSLAAQQAIADARAANAQAAAASVDKYGTQLAVDRAALARAERLYAAGVSPAKDVQAAQAQLAADKASAQGQTADRSAARAQAASAAAKSALANTDLANATLRSPVDGVVTAILRRAGESADPSTPVIAVGPPQQAEITLAVPATDATQIAVGDPAVVRVDSSSISSRGHVTAVVPAVDPATQSATVVVSGVPPDAVAGSAVRARITVAHVNGLVVPESAIVQDPQSNESVVFVQQRQKDGSYKFAERTVEVAHEDGTTAQLRSGVRPGERVAAQGAFQLLAPAGGGD